MSLLPKATAGMLLGLAAVCFNIQSAHAVSITAATMPAQACNLGTSTQNQIQGFSFTPTVDLIVTALGVADCNMNGLNVDTPVGLYRGDGALLVNKDLAAGTGETLEGTLRFANVGPVALQKGVEYRLLSFMLHDTGEPALLFPDVTFASQITINGFLALQDGGVHTSLPGLTFINSPFCCSLFGPSFKFDVASTNVPEPTTLALFGLGLIGFSVSSRREKRPSQA